MRTYSRCLYLCVCVLFLSLHSSAQKITFDMLKGDWEVNGSRDLKIFSEHKLQFNSLDARCYLKSTWTFDSDSTGFITVKPSDKCATTPPAKFSYQLFESPGYGGPVYKMDVRFENGTTDKLALQTEDGVKKLKMGYNQALVESSATDNRVWIYFSFKKKG